MPIIVSYNAKIALVKQFGHDDEISFQTSRWVEGEVGRKQEWKEEYFDVYKVRGEFLRIKEPRQALDFLRNTGEFLPPGDPITWEDFLLWQSLAKAVIEHEPLGNLMEATFAGRSKDELDPSGQLTQMCLLLTGTYPHTYFKKEEEVLTPEIRANLRRCAEVSSETPEQTERACAQFVQEIEEGRAIGERRQRELESWFYAPPPSSYSIEFSPRNPSPDLIQNIRRGGALVVDYIHPLQDLFPTLVIRPSCTLEAIAASIYADRIAGVKSGKCPGCGRWFEIESQKTKKYCDEKCRERLKKQRRRGGNQLPK